MSITGSECIIRWWKWLQNSNKVDSSNTDSAAAHRNQGMDNWKGIFDNFKHSFLYDVLLYDRSIEVWRAKAAKVD